MARDPQHWLYRLTAPEWLAAARNELARSRDALTSGDRRKGLFEARRAAGMACNALLCIEARASWGRSYMEHLAAIAADPGATGELSAPAAQLLEKAPPGAGADALVRLRGITSVEDAKPADWAALFIEHAAREIQSSAPEGAERG